MSHYLDFLYQSERLTEHPDFLDNTATPPERQFQVYVMENNGHVATCYILLATQALSAGG